MYRNCCFYTYCKEVVHFIYSMLVFYPEQILNITSDILHNLYTKVDASCFGKLHDNVELQMYMYM